MKIYQQLQDIFKGLENDDDEDEAIEKMANIFRQKLDGNETFIKNVLRVLKFYFQLKRLLLSQKVWRSKKNVKEKISQS